MSYATRRVLEYNHIIPAAVSVNLKAALVSRGNPSGIDDVTGLIGASYNQAAWGDAQIQSEALWTIQTAIAYGNASAVLESKNAFSAAFEHHNSAGWFENGYELTPVQAIEADTFFLAEFCQFRELISQTAVWGTYSAAVSAWTPKVDASCRWLGRHKRTILAAAVNTPNRVLRAAQGLILGGRLIGKRHTRLDGRALLVHALRQQHEDGYFNEKGGWDSGYQSFSLMCLCAIHCYALDESIAARALDAATIGATWLASRINATTGEVSQAGNTRTVQYPGATPDPANVEGEEKVMNYSEIVKALHDCTAIGAGSYAALGDKVYDYWQAL